MVSVSGAIGFVGLILPHAVRLLVGPAHRALLPLSALVGAVFLIWADTARPHASSTRASCRSASSPPLIGAPVFALCCAAGRATA